MLRNDCDYVVGRVLPYLYVQATSPDECARDFTLDEARQLRLGGLPLIINHADGKQGPCYSVGHVSAMNVRGADARVLLAIEAGANDYTGYASGAVARGHYEGISLGNNVDVQVRGSLAVPVMVKTPTEVSLCKRGRRPGSTIEHFFPCRATVTQFVDSARDDLHEMVSRFHYADELATRNVQPDDGVRYIDALMDIVHQRRTALVAAEQFDIEARSHCKMAAEPSAAALPVLASADAPPAVEQPASVETPLDTPNVRNAKEMALRALKSEEENVALKQRIASLEALEKRLAEQEEKERAVKTKEFEKIIESFRQNATAAQFSPEDIEMQVSNATTMMQSDPEGALKFMQPALSMAVRASEVHANNEKLQAANLIASAQAKDNAWYSNVESKFAQVGQQQRAIMDYRQAAPVNPTTISPMDTTPTSNLFQPQQTSFEQRMAAPQAPPQVAPPAAMQPMRVQASTDMRDQPVDMAKELVKQADYLQGRCPSYEQVSLGMAFAPTGQMQASADGRAPEPVMRPVAARTVGIPIEPANFAPIWDARLTRHMARGRPVRSGMNMTQAGTNLV